MAAGTRKAPKKTAWWQSPGTPAGPTSAASPSAAGRRRWVQDCGREERDDHEQEQRTKAPGQQSRHERHEDDEVTMTAARTTRRSNSLRSAAMALPSGPGLRRFDQ